MDEITFAREALKSPGVNMAAVARAIGVTHSWIYMFARGQIPDPSYTRVRALVDYLRAADTLPQRTAA